ncbi:hypothetical protein Glove_91g114 [Diversispora epigaea]|uniref:Uncharacterized protein n=1 Tax=Diversispora epigaea TaxID=1348612 RepID=A0A397J941_9GLOM|nr:hypothetical protein Glove_91g114 [Diversispora epigaea]
MHNDVSYPSQHEQNINNEYNNEKPIIILEPQNNVFEDSFLKFISKNTIDSSSTKAQKIFRKNWNDIINTIEKFLTSTSTLFSISIPTSDSDDQDTEHDIQAKEIKQYLDNIMKNVNTTKRLRNTVKTKLSINSNTNRRGKLCN